MLLSKRLGTERKSFYKNRADGLALGIRYIYKHIFVVSGTVLKKILLWSFLKIVLYSVF